MLKFLVFFVYKKVRLLIKMESIYAQSGFGCCYSFCANAWLFWRVGNSRIYPGEIMMERRLNQNDFDEPKFDGYLWLLDFAKETESDKRWEKYPYNILKSLVWQNIGVKRLVERPYLYDSMKKARVLSLRAFLSVGRIENRFDLLLKTLPGNYADILVLYYRDGMEDRQIADKMGVTNTTINQKRNDGVNKIMKCIQEKCV